MAGKKTKRAKKKGAVETVLVPVASTAIVTTAAIRSMTDHHDGHNGHGNGNGAGHPARPQAAKAPLRGTPPYPGRAVVVPGRDRRQAPPVPGVRPVANRSGHLVAAD